MAISIDSLTKVSRLGALLLALGLSFTVTEQAKAGSLVSTRTGLNTLLGGTGTTENFEKFNVSNGTASTLVASTLNSGTSTNDQGPGLVANGVTFQGTSLQWNGSGYFGSPSKEILAVGRRLTINFTTAVNAFGLDLRAFTGSPATATVKIFGSDNSTVLNTFNAISLATTGASTFFGYQDLTASVGKIELTQSGQSWSPIIDNLTFGKAQPTAVPTPALLPGLIGLGVAALRKRKAEAAEQANEA